MPERFDVVRYTGGGKRDAFRVDGLPASGHYANALLRCATRLESLMTEEKAPGRFAHYSTAVFDGLTAKPRKESCNA